MPIKVLIPDWESVSRKSNKWFVYEALAFSWICDGFILRHSRSDGQGCGTYSFLSGWDGCRKYTGKLSNSTEFHIYILHSILHSFNLCRYKYKLVRSHTNNYHTHKQMSPKCSFSEKKSSDLPNTQLWEIKIENLFHFTFTLKSKKRQKNCSR